MRTIHDVMSEAYGIDKYEDWEKVILADPITGDLFLMMKDQVQGSLWHPEVFLGRHIFLDMKGIMVEGQQSLLESAFIHDLGKTTTTNVGGSRIYSYGHDKATLALMKPYRERFINYDLAYRISELHMRYHTPEHKKLKDDVLGQAFVKVDKVTAMELTDKFFTEQELADLREQELRVYSQQKNSFTHIIMTIGISGSGKSTYLKANYRPELIVCPDQIREEITGDITDQTQNFRVWKIAESRLKKIHDEEGIAILDATNVNKSNRIKMMVPFNGSKKVAIVFNSELATAQSRVTADIAAKVNRSNVPMTVIEKQHKSFKSGFDSIWEEFNSVIEV